MEYKKLYHSVELKALPDEEGFFEGYASTFGNVDSTGDIIEQGAFKESLKSREPKVLWQHDMDKPVGKVVDIKEDEKGLYVKVRLAIKTTLGRDAYEYMKAGIINRLSIGFRAKQADYDTDSGLRTIKEIELFEFSLVTIPANEMAEVTGVKSELPSDERGFEKFLRDNGYSRTAAKAIASRGIKGYQDVLRDAGVDTPNDDLREADEALKSLSNLLQTLKGENHVKGLGHQRSSSGD
jgi:HK97 family phage prohead protease